MKLSFNSYTLVTSCILSTIFLFFHSASSMSTWIVILFHVYALLSWWFPPYITSVYACKRFFQTHTCLYHFLFSIKWCLKICVLLQVLVSTVLSYIHVECFFSHPYLVQPFFHHCCISHSKEPNKSISLTSLILSLLMNPSSTLPHLWKLFTSHSLKFIGKFSEEIWHTSLESYSESYF